jgi:hypothetical protein
MRTYLDCLPCFVRQTLEAARFVTDDEAVHADVLRQVLRAASEMDMRMAPPAMGQHIHRLIREATGNADPYREVKERFNRLAMGLYPELKRRVKAADDPLETAVRLAVAGNIIDFGVTATISEAAVEETIDRALRDPLVGGVDGLRQAVADAGDVLYLADNAGEIVFDRVLIETLAAVNLAVGVKSVPVINDATAEDAEAAGLAGRYEIVENGSDAPGTLLETCSEAFRERFMAADLVIAKGQGNYETLSEAPRPVWFILMAKCPVIAGHLGCEVGSLVVRRGAGSRAAPAS